MTKLALRLKPGRERSVYNRHPWIFTGAVDRIPDIQDGTFVEVFSAEGDLLAKGHFSKQSQILCRLLSWGSDTDLPENELIQARISAAVQWRKSRFAKDTNGFRLIHAEGDFLPGLIVDQYADTLVIQFRTAGMLRLKDLIVEALVRETGAVHVIQRGENEQGAPEIEWLRGTAQTSVLFQEHGFQFKAEVESGQKTGFFLDQRENRLLLKSYAYGKNVLNTFAYTGAFSVYALAGGAKKVVSVDLSAKAVEVCKANVELNNPASSKHEAIVADCFDYLKSMEEDEFDLIVLDPPAFTKHISTVDKAARGYKEINMKALRKIAPGGILFTFSCSQHISADLFRKIVFGAAADAGREVQVLHRLAQPEDHPVSIFHPEGEYLKGLVVRVL